MATRIIEESYITSAGTPGSTSAISWPAVLAGATAAAALSLILLVLGTGLGLAVVSPWQNDGPSMTAMSWSTILWILFAAFASSALGGYIAGRLRVRWPGTQMDEVYFRDTAHGFLAWAVASLLTAAMLASAIGAIAGTAAVAAGGAASLTAADGAQQSAASGAGPSAYVMDSLLRASPNARSAAQRNGGADARAEIMRIFGNGMATGTLPREDASYAAQLIAQQTGLSQAEAEQRVDAAYTTVMEAADTARRNGAYASLWIFVSLLVGAFSASLMATFGGRQRDLM